MKLGRNRAILMESFIGDGGVQYRRIHSSQGIEWWVCGLLDSEHGNQWCRAFSGFALYKILEEAYQSILSEEPIG